MSMALSVPSSIRGWGTYLLTIAVPLMIALALKDKIYTTADNIYDGRNGS